MSRPHPKSSPPIPAEAVEAVYRDRRGDASDGPCAGFVKKTIRRDLEAALPIILDAFRERLLGDEAVEAASNLIAAAAMGPPVKAKIVAANAIRAALDSGEER